MCGIAGFIGSSKNPLISYQLISSLFKNSETRGTDAAGFWATQVGNSKIFYHKEPQSPGKFLNNNPIWEETLKHDLNLILVHARGASKGVGEPKFNENNHPFTSTNKLIGLVHNGRIYDEEYNNLKKHFELFSNCDSEILLRIYEASETYSSNEIDFLSKRLLGIKNIFSLVNEGHMAVAIGEKIHKNRILWLFRNEHRPLWMIDLRENLGQIFFVSEPSIWFSSIDECRFNDLEKQTIVELLPKEIWSFIISSSSNIPEIKKYQFSNLENSINKNYYNILNKNPICEIVTGLDEKDQVIENDFFKNWEQLKFDHLEKIYNLIFENLDSIRYVLEQRSSEKSLSQEDFDKVINTIKNQNEILERLMANL